MTDKQPVILPWDDLQELLMYFSVADEKAVDMLRGLKPVVLDLSGIQKHTVFSNLPEFVYLDPLLAAIRAQLPGVEVRA